MSWQDRHYYRDRPSFNQSSMSVGIPKPTRWVVYLIAVNVAIFILEGLGFQDRIENSFALVGVRGTWTVLELWRLITYQFIHGNPGHLFWNMVGLYFFGPVLERYWGARRFLFFYFFCGVAGGVTFLVASGLFPMGAILIGASGAVLGLVMACAVLFPSMVILLLFFPVPIRLAAILVAAFSALTFFWNKDLAEACHLGGMAAGFLFIRARPFWETVVRERRALRRQALLDQEDSDQKRVDEILDKVHRDGIQSLTRGKKGALREITRRQKMRDQLQKNKGNFTT